jgi:CRISPR-associated protein Cas2
MPQVTPPKHAAIAAEAGSASVYLVVITFDVTNDRRRRQLTRVLQSWGNRVLESVFEAWLTEAQCRKLERKALSCIQLDSDRLALYTLPPADAIGRITLGHGQPTQDLRYAIV